LFAISFNPAISKINVIHILFYFPVKQIQNKEGRLIRDLKTGRKVQNNIIEI